MKRKNIIKCAIAASVITSASLGGVQINKNSSNLELSFLANIEALARGEQSDVKDCIYSEDTDCIAMHPTDPSLDVVRKNAEWPN